MRQKIDLALTFAFAFIIGLGVGLVFALPYPVIREQSSVLGVSTNSDSLTLAMATNSSNLTQKLKIGTERKIKLYLDLRVAPLQNSESSLIITLPKHITPDTQSFKICPGSISMKPTLVDKFCLNDESGQVSINSKPDTNTQIIINLSSTGESFNQDKSDLSNSDEVNQKIVNGGVVFDAQITEIVAFAEIVALFSYNNGTQLPLISTAQLEMLGS